MPHDPRSQHAFIIAVLIFLGTALTGCPSPSPPEWARSGFGDVGEPEILLPPPGTAAQADAARTESVALEEVRQEIRNGGDAVAVAQELLRKQPSDAQRQLALVEALCASGASNEAVLLALEMMRLSPDGVESRQALALAWLSHGRPELAVLVAERAAGSDPMLRMTHAQALLQVGEHNEAAEILLGLVDEYSDWLDAWALLGDAAYTEADYRLAADALSEVVAVHIDDRDRWLKLANARRALGQGDAAERIYRRLLEMDPDDGEAHFLLGALYLATDQLWLTSFQEELARLQVAVLHLEQAEELIDEQAENADVVIMFARSARARLEARKLALTAGNIPVPTGLDDASQAVGETIHRKSLRLKIARKRIIPDRQDPVEAESREEMIARLFGTGGEGQIELAEVMADTPTMPTEGGIGAANNSRSVDNQITELARPERAAAESGEMVRYPSVEVPPRTKVGSEFAVLVSLTEEQLTPGVRVAQGASNDAGGLLLDLPGHEKPWLIDVVLTAPGFTARDGKNVGTLALKPSGDSTPAMFRLTPAAIETDLAEKTLNFTFWHDGSYIARVERKVKVVSRENSPRNTGEPAVAQPGDTGNQVSPGPTLNLSGKQSTPDLTVFVLRMEGDDKGRERMLVINSPHLQPSQHFVAWPEDMETWVARQFEKFAAETPRGVRIKVNKGVKPVKQKDRNIAMMKGFGRQMWEQFTPDPFRDAVWRLQDELGEDFDSIQIITNDPAFPWELLRPIRTVDGEDEELDFLGVQFRVARWHVNGDSRRQLPRPPQQHIVKELVAIAPSYSGNWELPNQELEIEALSGFKSFRRHGGKVSNVSSLLGNLPDGIVHFAGHGVQRTEDGVSEYVLMFEGEEEVDLLTWRGWAPRTPRHHPFFFVNACELGQASSVANFVDGWAPAVLETGASGYIGGLWPLGDRGAADFAMAFYGSLAKEAIGGRVPMVADALREARKRFYETGDPTYLGYVYYGDPDLRMVLR